MCESGKFYGTLIDPILKPMRKRVAIEIPPGNSVLDIACGTGAQVFELSKNASKVTGVDLSHSMIEFAKATAKRKEMSNVEFITGDATNLSMFAENEFDIATMTLALHQFSPDLHSIILTEMKRVADKIIIVDYAVPLPKNYAGVGSRVAEFLAGKEHHQNFKQFYKLGGLNEILKLNGLKIEKTVLFAKGAFQLVVCFERE
jgi:ubiquinone/menaquinone biosynthesis C-methylase UbiE